MKILIGIHHLQGMLANAWGTVVVIKVFVLVIALVMVNALAGVHLHTAFVFRDVIKQQRMPRHYT